MKAIVCFCNVVIFLSMSAESTRARVIPAAANEARISIYPPLTATCVTIVPHSDPAEPIDLRPVPRCHIVTQPEALGVFDTLHLPDGWTLKAGFGVRNIHWTAENVIFGKNTAIILSQDKPAEKICDWSGQRNTAPPAQNGRQGPAASSHPGLDGTNLTIDGIIRIKSSSLWVDISGGPGGDGGTGCEGQEGGKWSYNQSGIALQGVGGDGGSGGPGGNGGSTGSVKITYRNGNSVPLRLSSCLAICGPASRPLAVSGLNAGIFVYGAPGCGGAAGKGGFPGLGGIMPNGFNDLSTIGHMGPNATTPGQPGSCTE